MRRVSSIGLCLALLSAPATQAAPAFTARSPDLETYLRMVAATEAEFQTQCAALQDQAPAMGQAWLRIGDRGLELAPDAARDAEAAAFWAELALGARAAARSLYGRAAAETFLSGPVLIELDGETATIFDGAARTSGDLCATMARLVGAMGGEAANPFTTARGITTSPAAPVAIGGETEISLETPISAKSTLRGPDGVTATMAEDGATITVAASGDATIGDATLRIYDDANPFQPIDEVPISVLPGADAPLPARQIGALSPGGAFAGDLPLGGVVELDMTLKDARMLTLAGASDADLQVEVLSKSGAKMAGDDDSGDGYGFSVSADLPAGAYVVKITHCCGGGGAFVVSATSE